MWILSAVILIIATCVCILVPDPVPFVEEIILVAGTIFSFAKGIQGQKMNGYPKALMQKNSPEEESSVYLYIPPKKKSCTPKGFPQYDKNNPNAVYYYKKRN